jgi:hypothetical protein
VVGVKWGFQAKALLDFVRSRPLSEAELLELELVNGWGAPSPQTCEMELHLSAERLGLPLSEMRLVMHSQHMLPSADIAQLVYPLYHPLFTILFFNSLCMYIGVNA